MKIEIIGSVASGKTTLARNLSLKCQAPFYEKDNIVWERTSNGDRKRSAAERDRIFREIIERDHWIVEGSPRKNLRESLEHCDYIILLDVKTHIRLFRAFKRWIRQRRGLEKYNSKPTLLFLFYNLKWIFEYNSLRKELIRSLSVYGDKFKIFDSSEKVLEFIDKISSP